MAAQDPAASDPSAGQAADFQPRLAAELADEAGRLAHELEEIGMLIAQARTEASRQEARRSTAEQRLTELQQARREVSPEDLAQAQAAIITATRRAALMESQIDVLEGKQKTVGRMQQRIADLADQLGALPPGSVAPPGMDAADAADMAAGQTSAQGVLEAQEELRRGIARAMHDGPAQSLTNITLQAQIVQRLMASDPSKAAAEVDQLVVMVEHTLEATKSFIFDVRPMVLDDLGLVPTLRRAARDRGRRAKSSIDFDSVGADRRLPDELESALFRTTDEALTGYLEVAAPHILVRLDWTEREITTRVEATPPAAFTTAADEADAAATARTAPPVDPPSADLLPALAEMIAERAEARKVSVAKGAEVEAGRPGAQLLPAHSWRSIQARAAATGLRVTLSERGATLTIATNVPT